MCIKVVEICIEKVTIWVTFIINKISSVLLDEIYLKFFKIISFALILTCTQINFNLISIT